MGDPSRWSSERELEWVELRPELVVEVTFDHVSNDRIRHGTKLSRWRDDKDPRDCTTEQLETDRRMETNCVSLWAMPIHRLARFGLVNAYLVPEEDGFTLVDAMLPRSHKAILAGAEALGAPIRRIALTHGARRPHRRARRARRGAPRRRGADLRPRRAPARQGQLARPGRAAGEDPRQHPRRAHEARRATFAPGDRVGSLEVLAAPGHTPGQVAFRDPRDGTLYCGDAYATLGGVATAAKASWRFPLVVSGDVAQADGARDRAGAARARPRAARPRPRAGRRGARRRDGPRDRARGLSVPRRGLDRAQVIAAAVATADEDGLEAVTLARVAAALGVRSPSLYNHVDGRDALIRGVAAQATRELATALRRAATGRSGADAIGAVAAAQRDYARAHPGRYAATVAAPAPGDAEHEAAAAEAVDVLTAVLGGAGLTGDDLIHGVRALRSAVHGFAAIEAAGGFALAVDRDASFARLSARSRTGSARPSLEAADRAQ